MNQILIIPAVALLLSSCGPSSSLPVGKDVVVQFDRNSLGAAAPLPVSPNTRSINGAETSLEGKLLKVSDAWIVLQTGANQDKPSIVRTFWIPVQKVLSIRTDTDAH
jgi:hypothetical protein